MESDREANVSGPVAKLEDDHCEHFSESHPAL
jgi:hypothetical protein